MTEGMGQKVSLRDSEIVKLSEKVKIIVVLGGLSANPRGVMISALNRARRLLECGFDVEVRLLNYVLDFDVIKSALIKAGRLHERLPVKSIHDFLEDFNGQELRLETETELDAAAERYSETEATEEVVFRGVVRSRHWYRPNSSKSYGEYYRPDGSLYLRAFTEDRALLQGVSSIEIFNKAGRRVGAFPSARELWRFWFDSSVTTGKSLVVIQDGVYLNSAGFEVLGNITRGQDIYNIQVVHGASIQDGRVPNPVAGLQEARRVGGVPDLLVFLTELQRSEWEVHFGANPRTVCIPHELGVVSQGFSVAEASGARRIVSISSLFPNKRVDHLIKAFALATVDQTDVVLEIAGEGPERGKLSRIIDDLGLAERVKLLGYVENAPKLLNGAVASVITSTYEAFGMPIIESMAFGTPVLSYEVKYGPSSLIESGVNGLLIENGSVEKLAEAIRQLLTDTSLRDHLALGAERSSEKFRPERVTEDWVHTIEEIVQVRTVARDA